MDIPSFLGMVLKSPSPIRIEEEIVFLISGAWLLAQAKPRRCVRGSEGVPRLKRVFGTFGK
jgi:hypothetical protein